MENINNPKNQGDVEILMQVIENKIESLKVKYNLFFSGDSGYDIDHTQNQQSNKSSYDVYIHSKLKRY